MRCSCISIVYSNSLMATLNARKSLREGSANDVSVSLRDMQPTATMLNGPGVSLLPPHPIN